MAPIHNVLEDSADAADPPTEPLSMRMEGKGGGTGLPQSAHVLSPEGRPFCQLNGLFGCMTGGCSAEPSNRS